MPVLISKYRAQVFETQFKKAYSSVQNATKMLVAEGISPYNDFLCDSKTEVEQREQILINQTKAYATAMHGTICADVKCNNERSGQGWYNLTGNGGVAHVGSLHSKKAIMLNDGMYVLIGYYHWILVDINGPVKGPNKNGYDLHTFKITEDNNVKPLPEGDHDTRTCTLSNPSSTDVYLGYGCTGYAVMNKNPDGDGDYWHDFLKL